jgi:muramidase (phage lysozyme)
MTKIEARAGGVNVVAFLSTVAFSEGTSTHPLTKNAGYDVIVTGDTKAGEVGLEVFTDYSRHPFALNIYPRTGLSVVESEHGEILGLWRSSTTRSIGG